MSLDSNHVSQGITTWIHKGKQNGWKNSKKPGVVNATLWREFDAEIVRHRHGKFAWVNNHSGILLNECADQLATGEIKNSTYAPIRMVEVPPEEVQSEEEFVMNDQDVAQLGGWDDSDHLPIAGHHVESVGLAADEDRECQTELFNRFSHDVLGNSDTDENEDPWATAMCRSPECTLSMSTATNIGNHALQGLSGRTRSARRMLTQTAHTETIA
jgi:hypothetical protein